MSERTVLRRLMERMRADPGLLDAVVEAARAESPPIAGLPVQEVRRHIAALLAVVSAAFIDMSGLSEEDTRAADRLATDRALQGVPLAALLDGFQAARSYVLTRLMQEARAAGVSLDSMIEEIMELDHYANGLQNRLIHAYRETELSLAQSAHAARVQALRELLGGGPACAADAGLSATRRYHCLVTDIGDPREARRTEAAVALPDGVSGLVDGHWCAVTTRLPARIDLLAIAGPPVRPSDLANVYRLCRAALASARRRGLDGLRRLTDLAMPVALDSRPDLGAVLAREYLARLDPAEEFHRLLAETVLTYLDHGEHPGRTADALHIHPNTVKHRLRRFGVLTDFAHQAPPGETLGRALTWRWALQTWLAPPSGRRPERG
ncbi:helix-turn-helix domain-containing protein [Actinomadura opuntiae]|uniref:helix-turn-helix domain-containing protein n=1 Tax=Actinomadura sp. OS1-43 TaxID=604315 RepID=UPI00255B2579|nr:helix-turn-helix domain-containing protein [Actinomadura sp. OS1-43]MDL4815402.1 helix-turn-helix domain-containing protein [Actinomadura sp. OS1-43]